MTTMASNPPFESDKQWLEYLSRPARFLLIEDEPGVRATFRIFSERYNCVLDEAEDSKEGLDKFQTALMGSPYQGVFLDLVLPGESGIDVFSKIKAIDPLVPVIVVSGYITDKTIKDIHEVGFAAFVRKPQDFSVSFFDQLFATLGVKKVSDSFRV